MDITLNTDEIRFGNVFADSIDGLPAAAEAKARQALGADADNYRLEVSGVAASSVTAKGDILAPATGFVAYLRAIRIQPF